MAVSSPRLALGALALVGAGCDAGRPACEAEITDAGAVPRVSWQGGSGPARVEYGVGDAFDRATPETDDGSALLLGLLPLQDVSWRVVADGKTQCEGTIRTENLVADLPDLAVTVSEDGASSEAWWLVTTMGEQAAVVLLDRDGERLWGMPVGQEGTSDAQIVPHGAEPTIVFNRFDIERQDTSSELLVIGLDGAPGRSWSTPGAHHVFAQIPGGFAYLTIDVRDWYDDGAGEVIQLAGDAIAEVDADRGTSRHISSTWDWLPIEKHERWGEPFYPGLIDWTHANSLVHDDAADTYLMSLANAGIVAQVDASTGIPLRTFGARGSERPEDEASFWRWAHDASFTPDGNLLMFATSPGDFTRGVMELEVDAEAHTLTKVWSYGFEQENGHALGQAIRLENGNTLVNFGDGGVMREVTPEGEVVWELTAPFGTWFAQAHPMQDLYEGR